LHDPKVTASSTRTRKKNTLANCFRRFLDESTAKQATARGRVTDAKTRKPGEVLGIRAAEALVVATFSATGTELAPGVTLEGEKVQVDSGGRLEHVSATEAAKGPQRGAS
jgi:hypothetical protein